MSEITITMCDVKGCRREATDHYETFLVCRQENGDGAFTVYTETDIDLCGAHDLEYRRALPDIKIERKA